MLLTDVSTGGIIGAASGKKYSQGLSVYWPVASAQRHMVAHKEAHTTCWPCYFLPEERAWSCAPFCFLPGRV